MKLSNPGNDRLRTRKQLQHFRAMCRQIFSDINQKHPGLKQLEVFPILPVAAAVELGRVHMPKADPPLFIWDEQRDTGGFTPTFSIP
jgi:predicted RNase H-like nuclease